MAFSSTDPFNYGQNSVEYNQNGNSYNGKAGSMSSGSILNAGVQGGGAMSGGSSSNPFDAFLTHAMALSNYVNGGGPISPDQNATGPLPNMNPYQNPGPQQQFPIIPQEPSYTPNIIGRQPGVGMPQPPATQFPVVPQEPPYVPTPTGGMHRAVSPTQPPSQPIDNGGYVGPNVTPTANSGLSGIQGTNPPPDTASWAPGQYQFVPGYGWTSSPQEFQAAQNQVSQAQATASAAAPNASGQPQATPAPASAPTAPQAGSVQDMIHKMLAPLYQQQQGDLTRQLNANAAVTGDINSGGYSGTGPSSLNRQLSDLMAQQGSQESGYLQQANEDALQRALQLQLGQMSLQGTKYSADQGLAGARYGANATSSAANTAANASMHNADLSYNLGLGNMDVNRENNLLSFMANMYGMTPQMLSALLAGSPESLLSGQTVPTGNIVVKP